MSTILCFVFFFKATYLCLEKKSISKDNLWTLFSVKKTFYTLPVLCEHAICHWLFCAGKNRAKTTVNWVFHERLKFTSFKIFRMEKQIISVDGWWKQDPCSLFQKRRNSSFSFWGTSFILIDFLPLPSVDFFFHSQQFFLYLV